MPLPIQNLDDRRYQDLLDEALARIPISNPEWTNFNKSDPGVTLIEVFAFLTENLLYRANQIPDRNRRKFLSLLGVPLQPATSARGLVTLNNERGLLQTITLNEGLEVRAGQVPFRTLAGLDVLPVEAQLFYKRRLDNPSEQFKAYYKQLYASYLNPADIKATEPLLYETRPFLPDGNTPLDLGQDTVDGSLWIALLVRAVDKPYPAKIEEARKTLANHTLSLGIVPDLGEANRKLEVAGTRQPETQNLLQFWLPKVGADGLLPGDPTQREPQYQLLEATPKADVLTEAGVVEISLPGANELGLWTNLDPLEAGVGNFPPALEDTNVSQRVITWLRVSIPNQEEDSTRPTAARARLRWVGLNTVPISQRSRVANELLPPGTGEPDQTARLSRTPIVPGSVRIAVATVTGELEEWQELDDLLSAGPEVPMPDARQPFGSTPVNNPRIKVFSVNSEGGEVRFGDGTRGARPPLGAAIRASYDYGVGRVGNVAASSINSSPALPVGLTVTNPVPTWGGAEAESVSEGEKQVTRYLQHRDRLVTASDFETIALRTPGVDIGRIEVIPAYNPELGANEPGDAPGAVTLLIIPRYDQQQPDAPRPNRLFINAICDYLEPRRLVTTEVFLRGPVYKPVWVSVGIQVVPGIAATAPVKEAVKQALLRFLSPLPPAGTSLLDNQLALLTTPQQSNRQKGWPLRKAVVDLELLAEATRVPGVLLVSKVVLGDGGGPVSGPIALNGLELPRVAGIAVNIGEPIPLAELQGRQGTNQPSAKTYLPVPVIPEEC